MADNLTKVQRSKTMSRIRSKWTFQERKLHELLKQNKLKHRMHPKIKGSPDIVLINSKTAIFLNGCFWHKCSKCYKEPKTNKDYWIPKINKNAIRDKKNKKILKSQGFNVLTVWEHENKKFDKIISKLKKLE